jgi:hypothetical protein
MGWRFRNSVKLLPGVRLNFSKSGISTSVGGPGATINFGKQGTRSTLGFPGSGISYSKLHSTPSSGDGGGEHDSTQNSGGCGCWTIISLVVLVLLLSFCGDDDQSDKSSKVDDLQSSMSRLTQPEPTSNETVYVSANTLNGRSYPSTSSAVVSRLRRGDQLEVKERKGDWVKVVKAGVTFWIATKYISDSFVSAEPIGRPATLMRSPASGSKSSKKRRGGGGICPCSSRQICIGPRGGRYCITSGGSKRYGV